MQKITPFLWFNDNAEEAVNLYVSAFKNSKAVNIARYGDEAANVSGRPKGTVMTMVFELDGQQFIALNGGPMFSFTPAVSFFVNCKTQQEMDEVWKKLSEGGTVLMELGKYPFSEQFGWVQDKFGISWQLNLAARAQTITPFFMFVRKQHGKAGDAINFYISLFKDSRIVKMERYGKGEGGQEGTVKHAAFSLSGQEFMAIDSNGEHPFTFSEAISFIVNCETQEEVDEFWEKLSDGGSKGQCGWLKDKYGVSWQIVPTALGKLMGDKDPEKSKRVMAALLQMTKIDIKKLQQA